MRIFIVYGLLAQVEVMTLSLTFKVLAPPQKILPIALLIINMDLQISGEAAAQHSQHRAIKPIGRACGSFLFRVRIAPLLRSLGFPAFNTQYPPKDRD